MLPWEHGVSPRVTSSYPPLMLQPLISWESSAASRWAQLQLSLEFGGAFVPEIPFANVALTPDSQLGGYIL